MGREGKGGARPPQIFWPRTSPKSVAAGLPAAYPAAIVHLPKTVNSPRLKRLTVSRPDGRLAFQQLRCSPYRQHLAAAVAAACNAYIYHNFLLPFRRCRFIHFRAAVVVQGTKVRRYSISTALRASLHGLAISNAEILIHFQIKYAEAILSNSTRKPLRFD